MSRLEWNMVEINLIVILLFLGYLIIRNQLSFKQQRLVLLGIPLSAIGVIIMKATESVSRVSYSVPIVQLSPIRVGATPELIPTNELALNWPLIYCCGAVLMGVVFITRLFMLGLFFRKNNYENQGKYRIYRVSGKSSFSFFNRIQINPEMAVADQKIVLEHEKMHVDKRHSVDTILTELLHIVFWFNPVFFFLKREITNLHEFQVDQVMYERHKVNYMKFLLNFTFGLTTSNYLLTSRFYNQLTLKKRIKTMKTNYKKRSWMLGILPLTVIMTVMIQCTGEHPSLVAENAEQVEVLISDGPTVDADRYFENSPEGMEAYFQMLWGGEKPFMESYLTNMRYPKQAILNNEEGEVGIRMTVSPEGVIEQAEVVESVSLSLDDEALRLIKSIPYCQPLMIDGEYVRSEFIVPVIFELENATTMNYNKVLKNS